jgi:glycosyltransferase involved in cell wall biosynthesis
MPDSWIGHTPFAYQLVKNIRPHLLVELGTHYGLSYFTFCQSIKENNLSCKAYAVDTWMGEKHAGVYDESVYNFVSEYNAKNYSELSYLLKSTFDDALRQFSDSSIDILHIDGLHTYESVKHDFETWYPKVRDGGVILFHDISCRHEDFGVWELWEEIVKEHKNTFSFNHSWGLGVLIKGELNSSETFLRQFLHNDDSDFWVNVFTFAGSNLRDQFIYTENKRDLEQNLNSRSKQIAERDARIAERDARIAERDARIAEREIRIKGLKRAIASIKNSLIWRLSWPIRFIHEKVRKPHLNLNELFDVFLFKKKEKNNIRYRKSTECIANKLYNHHIQTIEKFNLSKPTIVLVTHEVSRTGAPILVLNLANYFKKYFNIIVLSLGDGELKKAFTCESSLFIGPLRDTSYASREVMTCFFSLLNKRVNIKWAIVNSIVSTQVAVALDDAEIPVVHLIHEFPSYTKPEHIFVESSQHSAKQVYSSQLLLDDVLAIYPELVPNKSIALQQGRCVVPDSNGILQMESKHRSYALSETSKSKIFLVVGMGYVHIRKGVDYFVECCRLVSRKCPSAKFKFIWYGDGYKPENDLNYSVYLKDQFERSDIEGLLEFRPATDDLESIYNEADLLLLTSRLDPLPLVSQDMMHYSKPVLCFDRSTGLAEFLFKRDETKCCVVPYGDIKAMADLVISFMDNPVYLAEVGRCCKELSDDFFDFEDYCKKLISIGDRARKEKDRLDGFELELKKLNVIDPHFLKSETHPSYRSGSEREYLLGMKNLIHPRRPFAGFNPKAYEEDNKCSLEPTCDFVQKSQPSGRWNIKCINLSNQKNTSSNLTVALHLHIFYKDMAEELALRIKNTKTNISLFISVPDKITEQHVYSLFAANNLKIARIAIVPNRGRDIGPFLTEFSGDLNKFDIVGHAHTKKSIHQKHEKFIQDWSNMLLENVLGGNTHAIDIILKQFEDDPLVGLVFPSDPYITGWEKNKEHAYKLTSRLKLNSDLPDQFDYPVGNMFWARVSAIKTALLAEFQWEDYPPEPLPYDGSDLHALERLWPFIVSNQGYKIINTCHPDFRR